MTPCRCGCGALVAGSYKHGHNRRRPLADRLTDKIGFTLINECWPWLGHKDEEGYGLLWTGGNKQRAHRLSYELFVGAIGSGLVIDHLCRNRVCCNPFHLEAVTRVENVLRGEGPTAVNARKKFCCRGHELTADNIYRSKAGGRRCKLCYRERARVVG